VDVVAPEALTRFKESAHNFTSPKNRRDFSTGAIEMKRALPCLAAFLLLGALTLRASEDQHRLLGTWSFQREVDTKSDGSPAPAGVAAPDCDGLLTYTADGFMSVVIMPKGRTWSTDTATIGELRNTVGNGTAYAGRYELDEATHTITHIPSVSLEPSYQNQRLVRTYSLQGNTLQLSGTFDYQGTTIRFAITWVRTTKP
jgi:hypothetical protein